MPKVMRRTRVLSMPEPLRQILVHDHGASGETEPCAIEEPGEQPSDGNGRHHHQQAIARIVFPKDRNSARDRSRHKLHLAPKGERYQLADNDTETPRR